MDSGSWDVPDASWTWDVTHDTQDTSENSVPPTYLQACSEERRQFIPDIAAKDIDTADEVPSCSKGTLVDVKTLSPGFGDVYPDDRTGESNAAVNARQVRVNQDYHKKAKDLDTRLGRDQQGGFDAELSTFGRDKVVQGPIFLSPPPEGGLDLVTNRQGAILAHSERYHRTSTSLPM